MSISERRLIASLRRECPIIQKHNDSNIGFLGLSSWKKKIRFVSQYGREMATGGCSLKRRFFVWIAAAMVPFFAIPGIGMGSGSRAASLNQGVLLRVADVVITAADLSVPIYPGAQQAPGAFKTRNANGFAVSAAFLTRATRDQVVSFYRARLAGRVAILPSAITTTLAVSNSSTDKVMITVLGSSVGTRITIMHTIRPAAK